MADIDVTLQEHLDRAKSLGHEWVQLLKRTRSGGSPRCWDRCRVVTGKPSLMGRCIGPGRWPGEWRFDVRVADLERWLDARKSQVGS